MDTQKEFEEKIRKATGLGMGSAFVMCGVIMMKVSPESEGKRFGGAMMAIGVLGIAYGLISK